MLQLKMLDVIYYVIFLQTVVSLLGCNQAINISKSLARIKRECGGGGFSELISGCTDPPSDVLITPTNSASINVGENATFNCSAKSIGSTPVFQWERKGEIYTSGSVLLLKSVQPRDAGSYTCRVTNRFGDTTEFLQLEVPCGGKFTGNTGIMLLPGMLGIHDNCSYEIDVMKGCDIDLYFLNASDRADYGYQIKVFIKDGGRLQYNKTVFTIGSISHLTYQSSITLVYSRYQPGNISSNIEAFYNTTPAASTCGSNFTEMKREVIFPRKATNCTYWIILPQRYTVTFRILNDYITQSGDLTIMVDDPSGTSEIYRGIGDLSFTSSGNMLSVVYSGSAVFMATYQGIFTDINECENETLNTCPHDCEEGSLRTFSCRCWDGYIGYDGKNCQIDFNHIGEYLNTFVTSVSLEGSFLWNNSLNNNQSQYYKRIEKDLTDAVDEMFVNHPGYRETILIGIRQPNITIDFVVILTKSSNTNEIKQTIQSHIRSQTFGNLFVKNDTLQAMSDFGFIHNITIDKKPSVKKGSNISVTCQVMASSLTGWVNFEWKLNDSHIRPTHKSRMQTTQSRITNMVYHSTLKISDVKQSDAGDIQCTAILGNTRKHVSTVLHVLTYKLSAVSHVVLNGSNVSVICEIMPVTKLASLYLQMFHNHKIVPNSQLDYDTNIVTFKLSYVKEKTVVGCGWKNETRRSELVIDVVNPEIKPCLAEKHNNTNILWNETYPGKTDLQSCPPGFKGQASRECVLNKYDGQWKEPSLLNCSREVFAKITEKLEQIKDGVIVDNISNVLQIFSNKTKDIFVGNNSTAGDIKTGVEILTTVSSIISEREEDITKEETVELLTSTDTILDAGAKQSWGDLQEKTGENFAAKIMQMVSDVSDKVLETLAANDSVNVVRDNLVMQIKNENIGQIKFPDESDNLTSIKSNVILSEATIHNSLDVNDTVGYSVVYYKTLSQILPTASNTSYEEISSPVIAFSISKGGIKKKLDPPLQLRFEMYQSNFSKKECVYWKFDHVNGGQWDSDGCLTEYIDESTTNCKCDHLTNFAVLTSLHDIAAEHHRVLSVMSLVGCIVSIICLFFTLGIYILEWKAVKSDKAVILVILCLVLILANIIFLAGIEETKNKATCTTIAVVLHLLFLIVLCSMASEGIIHAVLVISVFPRRGSINVILLPLTFGIPAAIVIIAGGATKLHGYGTEKFCWLSTQNGLIYAFYVPCLLVVLMNFVIAGLVLKKLFSTRATMSKSRREKLISGFRSIAILSPIFGLTWLFGVLSFNKDTIVFSYLFVLFNSLQGLLILVLHGIMNQKVQKSVKMKLTRLRERHGYLLTKSTDSTSNTGNMMKKKHSTTDTKTTEFSEGKSTICSDESMAKAVENPLYEKAELKISKLDTEQK